MHAIREDEPNDFGSIRELTVLAFSRSKWGHNGEADLIAALRSSADCHSYVAEVDGQVVGQIMFTPAILRTANKEVCGMGLAPMSVQPSRQRQGIGSALVEFGLGRVFSGGTEFVVVLGHPEYYSRFGFRLASEFGVTHGFAGIPQDCFFIRPSPSHEWRSPTGAIYYDVAFGPQHHRTSPDSQ